MPRGGKELAILGIRHLAGGHFEGIHPNTMHRSFVILARIAAHQERAGRNPDHTRGCKFRRAHLFEADSVFGCGMLCLAQQIDE